MVIWYSGVWRILFGFFWKIRKLENYKSSKYYFEKIKISKHHHSKRQTSNNYFIFVSFQKSKLFQILKFPPKNNFQFFKFSFRNWQNHYFQIFKMLYVKRSALVNFMASWRPNDKWKRSYIKMYTYIYIYMYIHIFIYVVDHTA